MKNFLRNFKGFRGNKIHFYAPLDGRTRCGLIPYIIAWQGPGVRNTDKKEYVTCKNCLRSLNKKFIKKKCGVINYCREGLSYGGPSWRD